jgi:hypothetical protein
VIVVALTWQTISYVRMEARIEDLSRLMVYRETVLVMALVELARQLVTVDGQAVMISYDCHKDCYKHDN